MMILQGGWPDACGCCVAWLRLDGGGQTGSKDTAGGQAWSQAVLLRSAAEAEKRKKGAAVGLGDGAKDWASAGAAVVRRMLDHTSERFEEGMESRASIHRVGRSVGRASKKAKGSIRLKYSKRPQRPRRSVPAHPSSATTTRHRLLPTRQTHIRIFTYSSYAIFLLLSISIRVYTTTTNAQRLFPSLPYPTNVHNPLQSWDSNPHGRRRRLLSGPLRLGRLG